MAGIGYESKILKRGVTATAGAQKPLRGTKGVAVGIQKFGPRMGVKKASTVAVGIKPGKFLHHSSKAGIGGGKVHSITMNKKGAAALGGGSVAAVGGSIWHQAHQGTAVKFRAQNKHPMARGY